MGRFGSPSFLLPFFFALSLRIVRNRGSRWGGHEGGYISGRGAAGWSWASGCGQAWGREREGRVIARSAGGWGNRVESPVNPIFWLVLPHADNAFPHGGTRWPHILSLLPFCRPGTVRHAEL